MKRIEKTATFVVALSITFLGATFAIAPLALSGPHSTAAYPALVAQMKVW